MREGIRANTTDHISRLQHGATLPIAPELFAGDTRIVGRWRNEPFEYDLPGLDDHIISATHVGVGIASVKSGRELISAPARRGMLTIAPRRQSGLWRSDGVIEASNIFLGRQRLMSCADEIGNGREPELRRVVHFDDPKLFKIMTLIDDEIRSGEAMSHLFIEQLVDLVCLQLIRSHSTASASISRGPKRGLADWQVKRVVAYIRDNHTKGIRLQELSELVGLSRFHFCTAFRTATGYTPHEWITHHRIACAKKLLTDPKLSITDITFIVGYETHSSFTASFRKVVGLTPSQFRRAL